MQPPPLPVLPPHVATPSTPLHPPPPTLLRPKTPKVKATDAAGAGYGGDWAVRLQVARHKRGKSADDEEVAPRRLSFLVYVIDSRFGAARMEALPDGHKKKLGKVRGRERA